ncbi:MAG: DUF484 family protein, partial [Burkholderiales bacterium]
KQHPEFFEEQADFLATIMIPHPHGGRAIPISERQILTLRDKGKLLEDKLRELLEFGEQNDAIGEKLHRLTLALVTKRDVEAVVAALHFNLREDFAVPHTVLRLWPEGAHGELPEFDAVSPATRDFAESLSNPYCSAHAMVDTAEWFGEAAAHLRSFAYVALKNGHTFGLLAMASEDAQRFYPEMGTLYLKRLGEVTAAAVTGRLA